MATRNAFEPTIDVILGTSLTMLDAARAKNMNAKGNYSH